MNLHKILRRYDSCCAEINAYVSAALEWREHDIRYYISNSAYSIIKLHDIWAAHCRQLVLCSCSGKFTTMGGKLLPRDSLLPSYISPIEWLRCKWTKKGKMDKRWEPNWYMPDQCLRAAKILSIANYDTVFNALSAITIMEEVRWTRNAVVHSLPATYSQFRSLQAVLGHSRTGTPSDFIFNRRNNTGPMLIDDWISQLRLCLVAAIR